MGRKLGFLVKSEYQMRKVGLVKTEKGAQQAEGIRARSKTEFYTHLNFILIYS